MQMSKSYWLMQSSTFGLSLNCNFRIEWSARTRKDTMTSFTHELYPRNEYLIRYAYTCMSYMYFPNALTLFWLWTDLVEMSFSVVCKVNACWQHFIHCYELCKHHLIFQSCHFSSLYFKKVLIHLYYFLALGPELSEKVTWFKKTSFELFWKIKDITLEDTCLWRRNKSFHLNGHSSGCHPQT